MPNAISTQNGPAIGAIDLVLRSGRWIFAFAVIALGMENIVCATGAFPAPGPPSHSMPVLPFMPAIPWLVILFGALWTACGVGLLAERWLRISAYTLGATYIFWTLVHVLPQYIAQPGNMGLRTIVFEPLSLASIALLLPGAAVTPKWLSIGCRAIVAIAMIVFGVDHFIGIVFIGSLIPGWIPWHEPFAAFFGVLFIACGVGIGLGILERWSWIAIGFMFAVWVITLHVPRTIGFYGIPGAITDPDEWSSLFIAVGLWGGPWAVANLSSHRKP
ncbi:MAG TPA: hypothetical protein VGG45_13720 [Terracidiphilus sp.]|jgi:hypothetical protein